MPHEPHHAPPLSEPRGSGVGYRIRAATGGTGGSEDPGGWNPVAAFVVIAMAVVLVVTLVVALGGDPVDGPAPIPPGPSVSIGLGGR